jgi:monofunctional biosynthetic peptidoglycan transglycosylase
MAENGDLSRERRTSGRPRRRRRSLFRRVLRQVFIVFAFLIAIPLALAPLYSVVDPPITTVMLWKELGGAGVDKTWTDIEDISPDLVRAVLASEDARFCAHHGIDWVELQNALDDDDGRMRGASTITMQTVKNLFLWTDRDWVRKGLEAPLALYAEVVMSKRRIMEIYLNVVEWGSGIYGAAAASDHYFGVPPSELSAGQAARLAAILPAPLSRNAANPGPGTRALARSIEARASQSGPYVTCVLD